MAGLSIGSGTAFAQEKASQEKGASQEKEASQKEGADEDGAPVAELLTPVALPKQVAAKEGHVKVAGASLWYWDTGGEGEAVVLVHPGTGSGLVWGYQQPVFAKTGYRVIGYSRKNYINSKITSPEDLGSEVEDLHALVRILESREVSCGRVGRRWRNCDAVRSRSPYEVVEHDDCLQSRQRE